MYRNEISLINIALRVSCSRCFGLVRYRSFSFGNVDVKTRSRTLLTSIKNREFDRLNRSSSVSPRGSHVPFFCGSSFRSNPCFHFRLLQTHQSTSEVNHIVIPVILQLISDSSPQCQRRSSRFPLKKASPSRKPSNVFPRLFIPFITN